MEPTPKPFPSLADVEREVAAEGREWTRQRLQERLQRLADQQSGVSPLRERRRRKLTLLSEFGEVELVVDYGEDPQSRRWGCPVKRAWDVGPHQKLLPGLTEKLCFTVTATGCYEEAAAVASKWAVPVDDLKLHTLVQRIGARAEAQIQQRLASPPAWRWLGQAQNQETPREMA
jgi:hypothetical protein